MKTLLFAALVAFATSASASTDNETYTTEDASNLPALLVAAAHGDVETTRALIAAGADVHARGWIGNTALIYAAQEGHTEIAEMLVEAGADPDASNDYGSTARKLAKGYGQREIVELFEATSVESRRPMIASLF
jgi:ankyrin repeat protein